MDVQHNQYRAIIVGGGSAGWLLACRLSNHYRSREDNRVAFAVIESPDIPSIGVGEGSWPTMRKTLRQVGLKESDFLRACGASFKQGTKFTDWRHESNGHSYYHPFEPPRGHDYCNAGQRWLDYAEKLTSAFSFAVSPQPDACNQSLAPKSITTAQYQGMLNYGYHFDAVALGNVLRDHATKNLGVQLITDNVVDVIKDNDGWINSVRTNDHGQLKGDFFFDCTGFRSLLMHQALEVPYKDLNRYLFVDNAIAVQVPHESDQSPIASTTHSTAHDAGWIWDIPMRDRRGVGAVYSSAHMSDDEAASVLHRYIGKQTKPLSERKIRFKSRYLERFWEKNVVAVGLSAGFVEPLEASALVLIETSADWFCNRFPSTKNEMVIQSRHYNQTFNSYWEQIVEFLKFHYVLSNRKSQFWRDNRREESIPERLLEHMQIWKDCVPFSHDFVDNSYIFSWQSFQYVYLGMQPSLSTGKWSMSEDQRKLTKRDFDLNQRITEKALSMLPSNRELLAMASKHDFSSI